MECKEPEFGELGPYDRMIPAYVRWAEPVSVALAEHLLAECALPAGAALLDHGAGTGGFAVTAAERGFRVDGIDISPLQADYLAGRLHPYTGSRSVIMDGAAPLAYPSAHFDGAFSLFSALFFGPATLPALTELGRVVRPGGPVAVAHWADANGSPLHDIVLRAIHEIPEVFPEPLELPLDYLKADELGGLMSAAGLDDVRVKPIDVGTPLPPARDFLREVLALFESLPPIRALNFAQLHRLSEAVEQEVRRVEAEVGPRPAAKVHVAYGRVPEPYAAA
ncbi:class I SAM-dependent methyltransferase [Actinoplanes sp. NBRC 103695]|uniref:class I SAM-dependent methyltransferase n=1 Tax=Actinoplanes sp. NBRC 103695 TaxID=3032202 RepID=UPI0024A01028|nr:class I SAM-dependent methyltransferase [Actinoplanes sp. NBRC 103695]GLY97275.1 hypothetical protein Acsp02_45290 [Actinoplanes sp. NBRC 103695]